VAGVGSRGAVAAARLLPKPGCCPAVPKALGFTKILAIGAAEREMRQGGEHTSKIDPSTKSGRRRDKGRGMRRSDVRSAVSKRADPLALIFPMKNNGVVGGGESLRMISSRAP
jgi:hypothetical protein